MAKLKKTIHAETAEQNTDHEIKKGNLG